MNVKEKNEYSRRTTGIENFQFFTTVSGEKTMVYSPLISILHSNISPRKSTKNIQKMYKNNTNQTLFSVNHPNHINTSNLIFQYLLGNKPCFFPHVKALKMRDATEFRKQEERKKSGITAEMNPTKAEEV